MTTLFSESCTFITYHVSCNGSNGLGEDILSFYSISGRTQHVLGYLERPSLVVYYAIYNDYKA